MIKFLVGPAIIVLGMLVWAAMIIHLAGDPCFWAAIDGTECVR